MQSPPRSSDRRPSDHTPPRTRGSEQPRDPRDRGSSSRPSEQRRPEQRPSRSSDGRPNEQRRSDQRPEQRPSRSSDGRPNEQRRSDQRPEQRPSRSSDGRPSRPTEGGFRRPEKDDDRPSRPREGGSRHPSGSDNQDRRRVSGDDAGYGDRRNVERRVEPSSKMPVVPDPLRSAPRPAPPGARRRVSAEHDMNKRRSSSLPVEVREKMNELDCDFPEGGRRPAPVRRQLSAPAGNGIPFIKSCLRVATQFLSLKIKGLTQDLTQHKRVEFAFLEVREYPIVIGDNPSVKEGPPITIDWAFDPTTQFVLDVNTFENMRGNRRVSNQLVLPKEVREKWYAHLILLITI